MQHKTILAQGGTVHYWISRAERAGFPLHIIREARHFANGDNPAQVNREIEHFIADASCGFGSQNTPQES